LDGSTAAAGGGAVMGRQRQRRAISRLTSA